MMVLAIVRELDGEALLKVMNDLFCIKFDYFFVLITSLFNYHVVILVKSKIDRLKVWIGVLVVKELQ